METEHTLFITALQPSTRPLDDQVHCLELVSGTDMGRRHVIGTTPVVIGRTPPADVLLGDSEVSRAHCRVEMSGMGMTVYDLKSTNGTYVNGTKIAGFAPLRPGDLLQVGRQSFKYAQLTAQQFRKSHELDRDLAAAYSYVQALLPPPLREGAIRADWLYQPCATLGGDAFGYGALGDDKYMGFLFDVSGHGAGAAMHSVAIMNVLRQRALPNTDMTNPAQVLRTLNAMFQMEDHAEMYFTMWYGVFDATTRRLDFASAGHHPAYMIPEDRSATIPLAVKNGMIGAVPGRNYASDSVIVPPGASIYLFSDGVFEIVTEDGVQWSLSDFVPLIALPRAEGLTESQRLYDAVRKHVGEGDLDDDFSLVVMTFD